MDGRMDGMDCWDGLLEWMRYARVYVRKGRTNIYINITWGYLLCDLGSSSRQRLNDSHLQFWDGMNKHGSPFRLLLAHPATQTNRPLRVVPSMHTPPSSPVSPL